MVKSLDRQDTSGNDVIGNDVVGAISALIRSEHQHAAHLARAMNLPAADTLALYHLANEPLNARELGARLGLTSGSVTALVDRLLERKLARRTAHATDRRVVLIELTKTGHQQSWNAMQHFIGDVVKLCADLKPAEQRTIERFLRALTEAVDTDTARMQSTKEGGK
jgi:DNA-binding MarR family transcriptional regulator